MSNRRSSWRRSRSRLTIPVAPARTMAASGSRRRTAADLPQRVPMFHRPSPTPLVPRPRQLRGGCPCLRGRRYSGGSRRSSTVHHLVTVAGDIAWLPQIRAVRNATTVVSTNDSWPQSCWFRPRCRGAAAARISRVRSKARSPGHCRDRCRDRCPSQAQGRSPAPCRRHPDRHRRRRAHRRPPPVRLPRPPSHRAPRRRPRQRPLRPPPPGLRRRPPSHPPAPRQRHRFRPPHRRLPRTAQPRSRSAARRPRPRVRTRRGHGSRSWPACCLRQP